MVSVILRLMILLSCFLFIFLVLIFFFIKQCHLSFFDLWIPITPLVSSNSSFNTNQQCFNNTHSGFYS
jgi:hypothetical protein